MSKANQTPVTTTTGSPPPAAETPTTTGCPPEPTTTGAPSGFVNMEDEKAKLAMQNLKLTAERDALEKKYRELEKAMSGQVSLKPFATSGVDFAKSVNAVILAIECNDPKLFAAAAGNALVDGFASAGSQHPGACDELADRLRRAASRHSDVIYLRTQDKGGSMSARREVTQLPPEVVSSTIQGLIALAGWVVAKPSE